MMKAYIHRFTGTFVALTAILASTLLCNIEPCCSHDDPPVWPPFVNGRIVGLESGDWKESVGGETDHFVLDQVSKGAIRSSTLYNGPPNVNFVLSPSGDKSVTFDQSPGRQFSHISKKVNFVDLKSQRVEVSLLVDASSETVSWSPAEDAVLLRYDAPPLRSQAFDKDEIVGFQHPAYTILQASGKSLSVRASDAEYIAAGFWTKDSEAVALLVFRKNKGRDVLKHPYFYRMNRSIIARSTNTSAVISLEKLHKMSSREVKTSVSSDLQAVLAGRLEGFDEEQYLLWIMSELDSRPGSIAISPNRRKTCILFDGNDDEKGGSVL